jgi:hypothetical protein
VGFSWLWQRVAVGQMATNVSEKHPHTRLQHSIITQKTTTWPKDEMNQVGVEAFLKMLRSVW